MMGLDGRLPFRTALTIGIALTTLSPAASAAVLDQTYCSSENTGSDFSVVHDIYQTTSTCYETCNSQNYAFAVVQYQDCWCSNYIPSSQQDTSSCSQGCPGFPDDSCGNSKRGLFGYVPLDAQPSGTAGASSSEQPTSTSEPPPPETTTLRPPPPPPTSSSPEPEPEPVTSSYVSSRVVTTTATATIEKTATPSVETSFVPSVPPTSSSIPVYTSSSAPPPPLPITTSSSSSSSSSKSHRTHERHPTSASSRTVVTVSGSVVTQTVVVSDSSQNQPFERSGLSGGTIAGIVIGVLIAVAAMILAAFLLWRRKKGNDTEGGSSILKRPRRTTSVLSKTGLLGRQSMSEHPNEDFNTTGGSVRHSMMFGATAAAAEGVSPVSPLGSSQDNVSNRRHSKPMVYDQRLNPSALFSNPEANGSRVSMQDQQDYSRPLGIANPDLRASFDSR